MVMRIQLRAKKGSCLQTSELPPTAENPYTPPNPDLYTQIPQYQNRHPKLHA